MDKTSNTPEKANVTITIDMTIFEIALETNDLNQKCFPLIKTLSLDMIALLNPSKEIINGDYWIKKLNLTKHPFNCGYFREVFRSRETVMIDGRNAYKRNLTSSIITVFKGDQISPFHRIKSTEIVYFNQSNTNFIVISIDDNIRVKKIYMPKDTIQLIIKPNTWFAFELEDKADDRFAMLSVMVTPGFDLRDFELADEETFASKLPQETFLAVKQFIP